MRYFLAFLIAIGIIILVFILVLKAFSGSSKPGGSAAKPLVSYSNSDTTVQFTIDGPVTADQTHQAVQITVGQTQAQINTFQGYEGTTTNTQSFANNQPSYANFLRALGLAGYTKGVNDPQLADYRGYCPFGDRYIYKIVDGSGKTTEQYWATSCGGQGTFKGSVNTVDRLFQLQIPNYNTLTQNLTLGV